MSTSPCGKPLVPFRQRGAKIVGNWGEQSASLMACAECGYLVFDPLPSDETLGAYYGGRYWEQGGGLQDAEAGYGGGGYHEQAAQEIVAQWRGQAGPDAELRVHEIGCGYGAAVHHLSRLGVVATGSDLSTSAVEAARRLGNARTFNMTHGEYLASAHSIRPNCYYMSHSLEHFRAPADLIADVFRALPDGGMFVIRVPNGMHLSSRMRSFQDFTWLQFPDHVHYFSPRSATCLLESGGFQVAEIKTLPREDNHQLLMSILTGRTWEQLPDPSQLVRAVCDNWLGMELQIVARKSSHQPGGLSSLARAALVKFEEGLHHMRAPATARADNVVRPGATDAPAWFVSQVRDGECIELAPHPDGKRYVSGDGVEVEGVVYSIPAGKTVRLSHILAAPFPGTKLVRIELDVMAPHDATALYDLRISRGGEPIWNGQGSGVLNTACELFVEASLGEMIAIEISVARSQTPSFYIHASARWIRLHENIVEA